MKKSTNKQQELGQFKLSTIDPGHGYPGKETDRVPVQVLKYEYQSK